MGTLSASDLMLFIQIPHRFMHALMHRSHGPSDPALNRTDVRTLVTLEEAGPASMNKLGRRVGMAKGSFTQVIDKLVRMELVSRKESPDDRRVIMVSITGKGKEKKRQLDEALVVYLQKRLEKLTDLEQEALLGALRTIEKISKKLDRN